MVQKPFDPDVLLRAVRETLDANQLLEGGAMRSMNDDVSCNNARSSTTNRPCEKFLLSGSSEAGYSCATASSAMSARAHVQQRAVDLVTLDITMPDGSGLDLLDQIKQARPDTAIIMLTAETDIASAIRALTAGAYGYLVKPIERMPLLAAKSEMRLKSSD